MIRVAKRAAIVVTIAVAAIAVFAWQMQRRYVAPGPLTAPATAFIPKGSHLDEAAGRLVDAGVIHDKWVMILGAKLQGARIKAGEYLFQPGQSVEAVVAQLVEGHTIVHKLTIPEGLTVRRVLEMIHDADFLAGEIIHHPDEGMIMPDTLLLSRDDQRAEVVARLEHSMEQTLDRLWANRAADLPLTNKHDALVLASIVERETAIAAERPHVAAVFENRLKLGMRLQSDPTVIYGLSEGLGTLPRPLNHADLSANHPWNTYVITGLPPTPIAAPGKAAIEAVLHPSPSQDLYFVANGGGGHAFAKSLTEHNVNVTRLRHLETNGPDRP